MIKGLDHFKKNFSQFSDDYVLIGGVASFLQLESMGAPRVRPTKDLDIVLMAHPSQEFLKQFKAYIKAGGYQIESDQDKNPRFYRFTEPSVADYPVMIELFASLPSGIKLYENQQIIPISKKEGVDSLSAILVDDEYFSLIKKNIEKTGDGFPILGTLGLIPLKAHAYIDLKTKGEDSKKWKKHRSDIINLAVTSLDGQKKETLLGKVLEDFKAFISQMKSELDESIVQGATDQKINPVKVIEILENTFL